MPQNDKSGCETARVKKDQKLGSGAYLKKPCLKEKIGVAIRDELKRTEMTVPATDKGAK